MSLVKLLPAEIWNTIAEFVSTEIIVTTNFQRYIDLQRTFPELSYAIRLSKKSLQHVQAALFHLDQKRFFRMPGIFKNPFLVIKIKSPDDLDKYMSDIITTIGREFLKTAILDEDRDTSFVHALYLLNLTKTLIPQTKVFEKCYFENASKYANAHWIILPTKQFGFRRLHDLSIAKSATVIITDNDQDGGWKRINEPWNYVITYKKELICIGMIDGIIKSLIVI